MAFAKGSHISHSLTYHTVVRRGEEQKNIRGDAVFLHCPKNGSESLPLPRANSPCINEIFTAQMAMIN